MKRFLLIATVFIFENGIAQSVGINTNTPDPSAPLLFYNKGISVTPMNTSQRNAIVAPAAGVVNYFCIGNR